MQRDEQSRIEAARDQSRAEGRAEGLEIGELMGRVRMLQSLLSMPIAEGLESLSLEQLTALESDLRAQLRNRGLS